MNVWAQDMTGDACELLDLKNTTRRDLPASAPIQDHARVINAQGARRARRATKGLDCSFNGGNMFDHDAKLSRNVKFLQVPTCYYFSLCEYGI